MNYEDRQDPKAGDRDKEGGQPLPARDRVLISRLLPADSPRLDGENVDHIKRLAEPDIPLPPILVDRSTMRVIDGMHRLRAMAMRGSDSIEVEYFEGSKDEVFLLAVRANIAHGLPLTQRDRMAAAERIVTTQPQLSDRAVAATAGLAPSTVAAIRRRATDGHEHLDRRLGRDGRLRPVDGSLGRLRATEVLRSRPTASLREVARESGISPSTVRDVRDRLARGDDPIPLVTRGNPRAGRPETGLDRRADSEDTKPESAAGKLPELDPWLLFKRLERDPSIRHSEVGRQLLRSLNACIISIRDSLPTATQSTPPHARSSVIALLRYSASRFDELANELDCNLSYLLAGALRRTARLWPDCRRRRQAGDTVTRCCRPDVRCAP